MGADKAKSLQMTLKNPILNRKNGKAASGKAPPGPQRLSHSNFHMVNPFRRQGPNGNFNNFRRSFCQASTFPWPSPSFFGAAICRANCMLNVSGFQGWERRAWQLEWEWEGQSPWPWWGSPGNPDFFRFGGASVGGFGEKFCEALSEFGRTQTRWGITETLLAERGGGGCGRWAEGWGHGWSL